MRARSLLGAGVLIATSVVTIASTGPAQAATPVAGFTDGSVASADRATAVEWLPSDQLVVLDPPDTLRDGDRVREEN